MKLKKAHNLDHELILIITINSYIRILVDTRWRHILCQNNFYFTGAEILASITPTILKTSDIALTRFKPIERDCYTDDEFLLPNLKWDDGYRYSVKNCLYEGALQKIITNCSCLPSFVEYNHNKLEICVSEKLRCALNWMNNMGSSVDPDLTIANNTANETLKCLQRCDLQTETIMTTLSTFPNKETFLYRQEFCFVLQKIAKICKNPVQKRVFESKVIWPTICQEVLEMNNTLKVCGINDIANETIANMNQRLVDFLFDYASQNLAVLNLFIRDPYYTSYNKTEQISAISFIGNAGGLVSLCLGMSFVSIFEVFYHLFNCIFTKFQNLFEYSGSSKAKIIEIKE